MSRAGFTDPLSDVAPRFSLNRLIPCNVVVGPSLRSSQWSGRMLPDTRHPPRTPLRRYVMTSKPNPTFTP